MATPLELQLKQYFKTQREAIEFTDLREAVTGTFIEGTDTLNPDPQVGLEEKYIWVHAPDARFAVPVLIGDRMIPYRRTAGKRCMTGFNTLGERFAVNPLNDGISAGATVQAAAAAQQNTPMPQKMITGGRVLATSAGGLKVYVEADPTVGWDGGEVAVDSGDIPANPGEFGWLVWFFPEGDTIPTYFPTIPVIKPSKEDLLLADARNLALPAGAIRLQAITVYEGQADILASNTRVEDLRRFKVPESVVVVDTTGGSDGDVPTYVATTDSFVLAAQTGGGVGGSASLLLDYAASTDLFNGTSITANTWTDVNTNQSFTVTNGSAIIEFNVICNLLLGSVSSSSIALRLVIDSAGTPVYRQLVGVRSPAGDYGAAPGGVVAVTGLSAAAHTAKVQVQITSTGTAYLRANTVPDYENLRIQVTQL